MYNLNKNQIQAAKHLSGPMMVLAGPGSGKTAVITERAAYLTKKVNSAQILVITYSKAAALEMEKRYRGDAKVSFGTFHAVFFRILRRAKNIEVEQIIDENERRQFIRGCLAEMGYDSDDEFLSSVIGEMSLMRNELFELNFYHSKSISSENFREICNHYEKYKLEKNKIDFDDMLCHSYEILKNDAAQRLYWQKRFSYIMIDEFQDINRVQYESVKILATPSNNLFIVGDDDQSIYRFRGSRPEFLLNFPNDFPETNKITLETNYRSTDEIIKYANNLIADNEMRYNKNIVGTGKNGITPKILVSNDQNHEATQIAEIIRKLMQKGENLDEICIAYRLNMQARAFMDTFLNMNIPFKNRDEMPCIYEHWVARDLFAYLKVARRLKLRQKIGYDENAERIINKPWRFISKAFLQTLKKHDLDLFKAYSHDQSLHIATKNNIEELHADLLAASKRETSDAIRYIRKNIGYNQHIISTCEYRKISPKGLFEVADELQEAAKQYPNPDDFISHGINSAKAAKEQLNAGPYCTLTTLHSAKGLEFGRVFIAGVVEEVIPSIRSRTAAEIEEERRLLYVGVTRAKEELYLSILKTRYDKDMKPSRFLGNLY